MSSIYRRQWEREAIEEMEYLEKKKVEYGWTRVDAEKYNFLKRELGK